MAFEQLEHPQQRAFLAAYSEVGNVKLAASMAAISRESHYDWLQKPDYRQAFKQARRLAGDALEDEAVRRARQGVKEYIVQKGEVVMHEGVPLMKTRYSDQLLLALLKAAKPKKYKDRKALEHTGKDGGPIKQEVHATIDLTLLTDDELDFYERIVSKSSDRNGDQSGTPAPPAPEEEE